MIDISHIAPTDPIKIIIGASSQSYENNNLGFTSLIVDAIKK